VKITATALRKKDSGVPDLDWVKRGLAELLDGPTPEPDGGIAAERLQGLAASMTAMGLSPAKAAALEWTRAGKLGAVVVKLSGSDLETALRRELGDAAGVKTARQMASLWRAVDDAAALPPGSRSGRLEIHTPKAADGPREIRIRWKESIAAAWERVPIMFMDATADAAVLGACFDGIEPSPRYVAHSPHAKIRQVVDRALSHAAIAPKTPEELVDASPSQRVNALTARANAKKVKARLIVDALIRYGGQPVVAIVPAATERVWREDVIPSWLTILHHGAITGLDAHKSCRAVYNVGRPLPSSAAVEAMAGTVTGIEPSQKGYRETRRELVCADGSGVVVGAWEHPDPLCEAFRRQVTETAIIQGAGRGRGLHRTADDPLDIILWTDVAVPELGLVEAETWEGPSVEDEMLAAGCWIELPADAARVHPEIVGTPGSLKKARQRMTRDISLYGSLLSKCPWSYRYRPATGGRSTIGTATFLNDVSETEARAFLESRLGPLALLERVQPPEPAEAPQEALEAAPEAITASEDIELPISLNLAHSEPTPLPEVFDLSSYRGGIMPPAVVVQARALQAALGLTQEAMAELIGVSRPHLANAQAGRYPLSEAAALRLVTLLMAPPPVRQPDLFAFH
jgi:DNA-binding XRE family transcriptional regulator